MKIIVSDFDLTFYDNNFLDNIELVNNWRKKGNKFVIATGRSIYQLRKVTNDYDIKADYYVCNDGGAIYDGDFNEIYRKDIDEIISKELFDYLVETKVFDKVLIDTSETTTEISTARINRLIGIIINRHEAQEVLTNVLNKYPNVHGYLSTNCLNITDISVNKANGIKFLMSRNNWEQEDIHTIGDEVNDVEMLQEFNGFLIDKKTNNFNLNKVSSFKEAVKLINESN